MNNPPHRFILSRRPKEYLEQGPSHCGVYSIKAVLEAFDKVAGGRPEDFHTNWISRVTGSVFHPNYLIRIVQSYGLTAKAGSVKHLSDNNKLTHLKSILTKDTPVLLFIGNGYWKDGSYSRLKAAMVGHIITVWGYDDTEGVFYIYDSAIPKERYEQGIPIGNTKRTYEQVLRDWYGALITRLLWRDRFLYIEVGSKK
ncbi:C39 family peptidase [Candidatus Gottesmanbacteria bacterium]|nr:C39 family peptidase [Candidatus Gottesmanbacteria bacterium]